VINKLKFIFWSMLVFAISYILRVNLTVALFLVALYAYVKFRGMSPKNFSLPNTTLLFLIIFSASYFIIKQGWQFYYIPFYSPLH